MQPLKKKWLFEKGRGSDMEINPIDLVEPDDAPIDMTPSRKRPRWAQHILQNAEGHETP